VNHFLNREKPLGDQHGCGSNEKQKQKASPSLTAAAVSLRNSEWNRTSVATETVPIGLSRAPAKGNAF
jgi:hypothetical protein